MAAVQTRERSSSTRKPFGWLQKLYKKSSQTESEHNRTVGDEHTGRLGSAAMFLGNDSSTGVSLAPNEISSLRPTISTRASSIAQSTASNAAIRNVEAISSTMVPVDQEMTPRPNNFSPGTATQRHFRGHDTFPSGDHETLSGHEVGHDHIKSGSSSEDSFRETDVVRGNRHDSQHTTSSFSSKESPMPSLFTTRTTETAPTISLFTHPASIMSNRTTAGPGAQDNASILTLASSSKGPHRRRNSTDTNCSVRALAPASARASFESGRTGYTDIRRLTQHAPMQPILLDDGSTLHSHGAGRYRAQVNDGVNMGRSVSGLSLLSTHSTAPDDG